MYDNKYQLSESDFNTLNEALDTTYGITIGSKDVFGHCLIPNDLIERYELSGKNITVTAMNTLGKTFEEMDISDSHVLRIYDFVNDSDHGYNHRVVPKGLIFNKQLDIFLEKGAVSFDHRGRPIEVIYYTDATKTVPVAKRTFNFIDFDKDTIIMFLGVPEVMAEALMDKLVWFRYETFHWAYRDGTWSTDTKIDGHDYLPFVNGQPDFASFYDKRVQERIDGRGIILKQLQPVVSKYIAGGLQTTDLSVIRAVGRAFLKQYALEFSAYEATGDEEIINLVIADTENVFLDYPTDIAGVSSVRQYLVNKLRQNADLSTPIV